ncbi:MAG TPA: hypothetical protein VFU19_05805 [Iamia sp.]|nr:hypothetical protein [Iamia sp.]
MGWHLFVLQATGPAATTATLAATGYVSTGHRLPVGEAVVEIEHLAPEGIAVVERPGPGIEAVARVVDHDDLPLALSADGGEAVTFLWQGADDVSVLSVFRDGRPYRRLVRADGEVVVDEGPALPIEATVDWTDAETALLTVAAALLGQPIGTDEWRARPTVVHRRRRRSS